LREYVAHRGFTVTEEYRDEGISGAKDSRPALDRLMHDARARRFDVVVVVRFDRFARSVSHLLRALEEFSHLGIDFASLSESIDTSTPMGRMIFTVLAAVAELERSIIRERVQAGVERARRQGKRFGRPTVIVDREKLVRLKAEGWIIQSIAKECRIARSTVRSILSKVAKSGVAALGLSS
jgi:DNA invertase Pin-like site-specific DNA recombinase